jgi:hypothetical protein
MDKELTNQKSVPRFPPPMSAYHNPWTKKDYLIFCFNWPLEPYPAAPWELPLLKILFVTNKFQPWLFFPSPWFCGWTGSVHPQEEWAPFGYRSASKVEFFFFSRTPALFWRPLETHCLNMAILTSFFFSKTWWLLHIFSAKPPFVLFALDFGCFCCQNVKIYPPTAPLPQKKIPLVPTISFGPWTKCAWWLLSSSMFMAIGGFFFGKMKKLDGNIWIHVLRGEKKSLINYCTS